VERVIESRQDLGITASVDIWADREYHRATAGSRYVMVALSPERLI
jgi:hypothetical protein